MSEDDPLLICFPWDIDFNLRKSNANYVQEIVDYAESRFCKILTHLHESSGERRRTLARYFVAEQVGHIS
jgi:hypothetical protein